jgi:hypothetical protein
MKCPRCKLLNPDSARRCDCGYDFETQTVEKSFVSESTARGVTKTALGVLVATNVAFGLFLVVRRRMDLDPLELIALLAWSGVAYYLYRQLLNRRDWARQLLALLTFPLGTAFFLSSEMKLYCLQRNGDKK